jgi:hypothetical protein
MKNVTTETTKTIGQQKLAPMVVPIRRCVVRVGTDAQAARTSVDVDWL